MDRQQQDYYSRLGKSGHLSGTRNPFTTPAKNQNYARNQHLSQMLERQEAQMAEAKSSGTHRGFRQGLRRDPVAAVSPLLAVILAFALGGLAAIIALYLRFRISGTPVAASPDMELTLNILLAISIAFLLREVLSLSAVKRMGAQFAGILVAMVTMHNVVHYMPDPFAKVFSSEWVRHVQTTTEAGALHFRGESYKL